MYLLCFWPFVIFSQHNDSIISISKFVQHILQHHPAVQNIHLQTTQTARAYLTKNRGFFDPKPYYSFDQKLFQSKNYYSIINGGIKIPNWIGDIKAEYNYNTGLYINSADYLPPNGLWSVGIELPLLKNFFIDERRWQLRASKINLKTAEFEQQTHILNFLSNALIKYWEWFEVYNKYLIIQNAVEVSKQRLIATVKSAELGDIPAIDTTETAIQYNNFLLQLNIAQTELQNIKNEIQYYMQWTNTNLFQLQNNYNYIPDIFQHSKISPFSFSQSYIDSLIKQHPAFQTYNYKLKQLQIERKFRIEMLKPQLDITYNALLIPTHPNDLIYNSNNYKWGINFSVPIFLRKERGELKLTNIKIKQTQNDMQLKQAELFIKANNYYNLYQTYASQLVRMDELIKRYEKMLSAERDKFFAGESSVFLVNSRENYLLDARIKQISFYSKLNLYKNLLEIALGQIPQ